MHELVWSIDLCAISQTDKQQCRWQVEDRSNHENKLKRGVKIFTNQDKKFHFRKDGGTILGQAVYQNYRDTIVLGTMT